MTIKIKAKDFDSGIHVLFSGNHKYDIQRVEPRNSDELVFVLREGCKRPSGKGFFSFYAESEIEVDIRAQCQDRHIWLMFNLYFLEEWEIWEQRDHDEAQLLIDKGLLWLEWDEEDGPIVVLTDKGRDFVSNLLSIGQGLLNIEKTNAGDRTP